MKKRNLITVLLATFLVLSLISNAFAITAKIGNSRMVLRALPGETLERSIQVVNDNEVPMTISAVQSGELVDNIEIKNPNFELAPRESEKTFFTIKADEAGTTESKINIVFTPESGNSVGLSAVIIFIASNEDGSQNEDSEDETNDEENSKEPSLEFDPVNEIIPSLDANSENSQTSVSEKTSPLTLLLSVSILLVVAFIVLLVYSNKSKTKKRSRRPRA